MSRKSFRIVYEDGKPVNQETVSMINTFDERGNKLISTVFDMEGKKYKTEWFEYDQNNKMVAAKIAHSTVDMKEVNFGLGHDANGNVVARFLQGGIPGYWTKETTDYDEQGREIDKWWWKNDQTLDDGGINHSVFTYDNDLLVEEKAYVGDEELYHTVKYLYDQNNLLEETKYYGVGPDKNDLYKVIRYEYQYWD